MRWPGLLGCMLLTAAVAGCAGDTEPVHDGCADAEDHDACHAALACDHDPAAAADAGTGDAAGNETGDGAGNGTGAAGDRTGAAGNGTPAAPSPDAAGNGTAGEALPGTCPDEGLADAPLPVPRLTLAAADGTMLNGTAILEGQTITFSAHGSSAAGLQAAALTVDEPNGTTTVSLYEEGAFQNATLTFPRAGIVNATLRVLDDAGRSASAWAIGYVDRPSSGQQEGKMYMPGSSGCSARVNADDQARLIGNMFLHRQPFQVGADVKWFSVQASSVGAVAICDPDGKRIDTGDSGGKAATDVQAWEPSTQYFVALHPSGPQATMEWTVTVHYGPKPA